MFQPLYRTIRNLYSSETVLPPVMMPLVPVVPLYAFVRKINQGIRSVRRRRLSKPVISIGNIRVGGTGKTAFTAWLAEHLQQRGLSPAILKRGEGEQTGVVRGDDIKQRARRFGDEAALLSRRLPEVPIAVNPDRFTGASQILEQSDPDLFLLDDGFQHRQLVRNLDLVLLDSPAELDQWQLPAGPLREPIQALSRADVVSFHVPAKRLEPLRESIRDRCQIRPDTLITSHRYRFQSITRDGEDVTEEVKGASLQLLTTLAQPGRLRNFLEQEGFQINNHLDLPDHASLDAEQLFDNVSPEQTLVTEKEWSKLPTNLRKRVGRIDSKFHVEAAERLLRESVETVERTS